LIFSLLFSLPNASGMSARASKLASEAATLAPESESGPRDSRRRLSYLLSALAPRHWPESTSRKP